MSKFRKLHNPRQLSAFIAAVAPLGLIGCSSPIGEFDDKVCLSEDRMGELSPSEGVDALAFRNASDNFDGTVTTAVTPLWGTPCAAASDPDACQATLDALPMSDPPLRSFYGQAGSTFTDLVITRAADVVPIADTPELLGVLGAIDTPGEALLVAYAEGHDITCAENNVRAEGTGYVLLAESGSTCGGPGVSHYEVTVDDSGNLSVGEEELVQEGDPNCTVGRRPDGLCSRSHKARSLGRFFANAAHLEAASVYAFAQLAGELSAHDAPRALVEACWRARADEIRHARATARLARRFGDEPMRPEMGPRRVRPLYEVAHDNGIEGCVRETFGALVATAQARRAGDRLVRRALASIAIDETRHAVLSWAIDGWLQSKLSARQRRAIAEGRREAAATLTRETERAWSPAITSRAGMPTPDAGLRMLQAMDAALWRA